MQYSVDKGHEIIKVYSVHVIENKRTIDITFLWYKFKRFLLTEFNDDNPKNKGNTLFTCVLTQD